MARQKRILKEEVERELCPIGTAARMVELDNKVAALKAERDAARADVERLREAVGNLLAGIEAYFIEENMDIERFHLYGPAMGWFKCAIMAARNEVFDATQQPEG